MELHYAPPAKSARRPLLVVAVGLLTTALALLGVYLLNAHANTNIMGLHVLDVYPVGAIAVGLAASSGYGVISYRTGVRIRRSLLLTIVLLQVAAYFAAEYIEFASHGWGSLAAPLLLIKAPYCELCEGYMKRRKLAVLPPGSAAEPAKGPLRDLMWLAETGDAAAVRREVDALTPGSAAAAKLPFRVNLNLVRCPARRSGFLQAMLMTGRGNIHTTLLDKVEVTREFIEQFSSDAPVAR